LFQIQVGGADGGRRLERYGQVASVVIGGTTADANAGGNE